MNHRIRRFVAFLFCWLLITSSLLGCASSPVDAAARMTLQSLRLRNSKAYTAKVCVLPAKAPPGTRFIAADDNLTTFVSDQDRDAFDRFIPHARTIYEFDPFAPASSAKLYPISMNLSCPPRFTVLRSAEDIEDGESRLMTVVRIPTDIHRELRFMVEQSCKAAALEGTDRRYIGQQSGKTNPVLLGRTNPQFEARVGELLGLNRSPEPKPSGPRSVLQQLIDTSEGQQLTGVAKGVIKAVIPGGTLVGDAAIAAGVLQEGTRTSRIAEACAEFCVGVVQIAVGCAGMGVGTGVSGTGVGAPAGVPVLVGSVVLTTAGVANVANSIRHLTIQLWRSDEGDALVSSSPPSQSSPAESAPQTAQPAPAPEPVAATPVAKPAPAKPTVAAETKSTARVKPAPTGTQAKPVATTNGHHPWPKYLGGPAKQDLAKLPEPLHKAYHSGLDKILPRQRGTAYYDNLSPQAKQQLIRDLAAYTKAFDAKYGTRLYDSMVRNGFPAP